jgi:hypothetical protein
MSINAVATNGYVELRRMRSARRRRKPVKVFRDTFWRTEFAGRRSAWTTPACDPYNTPGCEVKRRRTPQLLAAMEAAWKRIALNAPSTDPPGILWAGTSGSSMHWYQHLATPDRGREFLPYG